MLLCARVDEVEFESRWGLAIGAGEVWIAVGQKPRVDVVCAEVLDVAERRGEAAKVGVGGIEGGTLGDEDSGQ